MKEEFNIGEVIKEIGGFLKECLIALFDIG
jgi:hypothetical protein